MEFNAVAELDNKEVETKQVVASPNNEEIRELLIKLNESVSALIGLYGGDKANETN